MFFLGETDDETSTILPPILPQQVEDLWEQMHVAERLFRGAPPLESPQPPEEAKSGGRIERAKGEEVCFS